jgi:L-fuculose-phosphate aldolase
VVKSAISCAPSRRDCVFAPQYGANLRSRGSEANEIAVLTIGRLSREGPLLSSRAVPLQPDSDRDALEQARARVAAAARRIAAERLVIGTAGNVSERVGNLVAVSPTGAVCDELEPDAVAIVDLTGAQIDGPYAPTSELELHLGVYERYGAGGVVHAHSPMGTALSLVLDELPVVHYQMLALGGAVRVAPYATFGTTELAQLTLDALRDRTAALMANHGTIAHGPDLDRAVSNALLLEWACTLYWRAAAIGTPRTLDDGQVEAFLAAVTKRGYGLKRRTDA